MSKEISAQDHPKEMGGPMDPDYYRYHRVKREEAEASKQKEENSK